MNPRHRFLLFGLNTPDEAPLSVEEMATYRKTGRLIQEIFTAHGVDITDIVHAKTVAIVLRIFMEAAEAGIMVHPDDHDTGVSQGVGRALTTLALLLADLHKEAAA